MPANLAKLPKPPPAPPAPPAPPKKSPKRPKLPTPSAPPPLIKPLRTPGREVGAYPERCKSAIICASDSPSALSLSTLVFAPGTLAAMSSTDCCGAPAPNKLEINPLWSCPGNINSFALPKIPPPEISPEAGLKSGVLNKRPIPLLMSGPSCPPKIPVLPFAGLKNLLIPPPAPPAPPNKADPAPPRAAPFNAPLIPPPPIAPPIPPIKAAEAPPVNGAAIKPA